MFDSFAKPIQQVWAANGKMSAYDCEMITDGEVNYYSELNP